ncbi:MAG: hypothetical protein RLZZ347_765, partial [Candidatus Parcubacteria bacterium]
MIELATQALVLTSLIYGNPVAVLAKDMPVETPVVQVEEANVQPMTLESHVREYFKDTPVLAEVARCESTFRHILSDGKILRGTVNPDDVGVMQINEFYHGKTASKMDLNLKKIDDNLAYAKYLYQKEGLKPWMSSSKCWKPSIAENGSLVAK